MVNVLSILTEVLEFVLKLFEAALVAGLAGGDAVYRAVELLELVLVGSNGVLQVKQRVLMLQQLVAVI